MNINFPPVDAYFIQSQVNEGYFSNASELVRYAVRRLRETSGDNSARLIAALEAGEQALREGRTVPYTPELIAQIELEARQDAAEGRKPNPDVCG
jgi:antitoxin ParD1/3/4